ncbi:MAG: nucleotidyltransferase [Oscillospiraceae bacterium]|nr:nucleotidyltransferase [Oscillospiraceae bacterium]
MKFTETQLQAYAAPMSVTEDQKCQNAIVMVRDALKIFGYTDDYKPITRMFNGTSAYLLEMRNPATGRRIKMFVQGSYANNTCVRMESDVDIAIIQEDVFQTEYRPGITDEHYRFTVVPSPQKSFKDEIQECLLYTFRNDVERKNKSIKVHGNAYRKDADTVPCIRLRNYLNDYATNETNRIEGIVIRTDDNERIINYPEQHIENGVRKDNSTSCAYKRMVRIIKKMRHIMEGTGFNSAKKATSFTLESLLWNVTDTVYTEHSTVLWYTFNKVVNYLYYDLDNYGSYLEANGIKPLFTNESDKAVHKQFVSDLYSFYEYEV